MYIQRRYTRLVKNPVKKSNESCRHVYNLKPHISMHVLDTSVTYTAISIQTRISVTNTAKDFY
jgi:hypothetical protein